MEISPVVENDSYVVLGGQKARHMGMDESAEGFHILSNTLYKHKKLACIREYLCNAVDAHIEAGVTRPVKVSIDNNQLAITDYGKGIEDASMVVIYGTYFASTKKKDERQTGGFGLGSKAGFAYTDHFIVTSRHNGKATTYAVHVGNEDTDGVPAMRQMNVCPTTETGVTVSVPIASAGDRLEFINLCRRLVYEGGMHVELNGELLPTIDMAELTDSGFALAPKSLSGSGFGSSAYIGHMALLGNVAYPIDELPDFSGVMRELNQYAVGQYKMFVYRLAPGSARPVPSREGLSYNRQTIETLKKAMEVAIAKIKAQEPFALKSMLEKQFGETKPTRLTIDAFFANAYLAPLTTAGPEVLFDPSEIAINYEATKFANGQTKARDVYHFLRRRIPNARRALRVIFNDSKSYNNISYLRNPIRLERDAYMTRVAIRAAVKTGLIEQLYRRFPHTYTESGGLFKCRYSPTWRGRGSINQIVVCWTVAQARAWRDGNSMILVRSKLDDDQVEKFVNYVKKTGFEVLQVEKPAPVVKTPRVKGVKVEKAEPPKPVWPRAKFGRASIYRSNSAFQVDMEDTVAAPKAYLCTGGGNDGNLHARVPQSFAGLERLLDQIVPGTIITVGVKQTEVAKKTNIPNVCDLVLTMLEDRLKAKKRDRDEELYAFATKNVMEDSFYNHEDCVLQKLLKRGRRWACLVADRPCKPDAEKDKGYALWMLARAMMGRDSLSRDYYPADGESVYWNEHHARHMRLKELSDSVLKKADTFEAKATAFKSRLKIFNRDVSNLIPDAELVALLGWVQTRERQKQKGSVA